MSLNLSLEVDYIGRDGCAMIDTTKPRAGAG